MADRFADFDAAFAERDLEPLRLRLFGEDWELPGTMPAAVLLKVARYMAAGRANTDLTAAELIDLAGSIIPPNTLDDWHARGLRVDQLEAVVDWAIHTYMTPAGDTPGEAVAPTDPGSSSNGGGTSKPTSPASTDSSSPQPSTA